MYNENLALFNKLANICGNRYLAVKYLSSQSRSLGAQSEGTVLESKLLTWALTGTPPYSIEEMRRRKEYDSDVAELEDYLCYVDDEEVANQVRKYYRISLRNRHVVLDDSSTLDTYRQMRVNVILRMIWYGLPECEGGCMAKIKLEDLKYVGPVVDKDTEVLETVQAFEFEDAAPEEAVEEAPVEEVAEESVEEAPKAEEPNITEPVVNEVEHKIMKVTNLKIYASPSLKIPARSFTGNVETIGKVENFTIVRYVRPGFGSVVGYSIDPILD